MLKKYHKRDIVYTFIEHNINVIVKQYMIIGSSNSKIRTLTVDNGYICQISCHFLSLFYIHTYRIGHYNTSVRIYLVSHTTYVVCINFIHKRQHLQFKVDSERLNFWETFHGNFIFTLKVYARIPLRGNRRRNTFCILLWCLTWRLNPSLTSHKPTHYLLDYGDLTLF